jgi:flavorubredoxin
MTVTPTAPPRHRPLRIAEDTWVIQATLGEGEAPLVVHLNAMVITGAEPIVVDTGAPIHREHYLEDLFSIVDPADVRWVFISHDDSDHHGNLHAVMDACPQATLVANWFLCERLKAERLDVPPTRWRWLSDGEALDVGDRTLHAIRPPLYDSPTTRGLFDPTTGVYWASDCYATPVPAGAPTVADLDPGFWAEGFAMFQTWNSPWVSMVDDAAFARSAQRIEALGVTTIAGAHSPTIPSSHVAPAFEMLRAVPRTSPPAMPDQHLLDELIVALTGGPVASPPGDGHLAQ